MMDISSCQLAQVGGARLDSVSIVVKISRNSFCYQQSLPGKPVAVVGVWEGMAQLGVLIIMNMRTCTTK